MSDVRITGGCQCGAVRYAVHETPYQVGICHCRMCQKATGAPFMSSFTVKKTNLEWTRGEPGSFNSSVNMLRGFCRDCGTPLFNNWMPSDVIHLTIGSLDDPASVRPEAQMGVESRVAWFADIVALPELSTEDAFKGYENLAKEIQATNRQHPDHDTAIWPP